MEKELASKLKLESYFRDCRNIFCELSKHFKTLNAEEQEKYLVVHIERWIVQSNEVLEQDFTSRQDEEVVLELIASGLDILQFIQGVPQRSQ